VKGVGSSRFNKRKVVAVKLIIAIIRRERLDRVQEGLRKQGVCLMSVSEVVGYGREPAATEIYRGTTVQIRKSKLRLEIAVKDSVVDAAVEAIVRAGSTGGTGQVGDGKVFVMELEQCVRIRNGERGEVGVGTLLPETALPARVSRMSGSACPKQPAVIFN